MAKIQCLYSRRQNSQITGVLWFNTLCYNNLDTTFTIRFESCIMLGILFVKTEFIDLAIEFFDIIIKSVDRFYL